MSKGLAVGNPYSPHEASSLDVLRSLGEQNLRRLERYMSKENSS